MSKVKVKLNSAGVQELLKSSGTKKTVEAKAKAIANAAGHAKVDTRTYQKRVRSLVIQRATSDDMSHETLQKAVHYQ